MSKCPLQAEFLKVAPYAVLQSLLDSALSNFLKKAGHLEVAASLKSPSNSFGAMFEF